MAESAGSGFGRTLAVGLAGSVLAAVGAGQTWATATTTAPASRTVEASGGDVGPLALPLGLVGLAAWGAVLVLRRRGRRVVAAIGLLASLGVLTTVALTFSEAADTARALITDGEGSQASGTAWPPTAAAGAAIAAAAFLVAWRRAPSWPEMSSRYDAPTGGPGGDLDGDLGGSREESSPQALWKAMDEGRDPTSRLRLP